MLAAHGGQRCLICLGKRSIFLPEDPCQPLQATVGEELPLSSPSRRGSAKVGLRDRDLPMGRTLPPPARQEPWPSQDIPTLLTLGLSTSMGAPRGVPSSFGAGLAVSAASSRKERDAQQRRDPQTHRLPRDKA